MFNPIKHAFHFYSCSLLSTSCLFLFPFAIFFTACVNTFFFLSFSFLEYHFSLIFPSFCLLFLPSFLVFPSFQLSILYFFLAVHQIVFFFFSTPPLFTYFSFYFVSFLVTFFSFHITFFSNSLI